LLRKELVEDCIRECENGAFKDIGGLVLECAATPQFRHRPVPAPLPPAQARQERRRPRVGGGRPS
jgi:hypothetical protein